MVRGIKFVGIPVRNQDDSLKFYTEALGFKVATEQPFAAMDRTADTGGRQVWHCLRQKATKSALANSNPSRSGATTYLLLPKRLNPRASRLRRSRRMSLGDRSRSSRIPTGISSHFRAEASRNDDSCCCRKLLADGGGSQADPSIPKAGAETAQVISRRIPSTMLSGFFAMSAKRASRGSSSTAN